jgi:hypothetical protein
MILLLSMPYDVCFPYLIFVSCLPYLYVFWLRGYFQL